MAKIEITKYEKAMSAVVMGVPAPVALMLAFWWGSIPFFTDNRRIMMQALIGLAIGFAADATVLRKHLKGLFSMPFWILIALFTFYSILIYGFFMGFPVINVLVGIMGSYLVAKSCLVKGMNEVETRSRVNWFILLSTLVLLSLCVCTAWLALREPSIEDQIEGMLDLGFQVSRQMIWLMIIMGGAGLLLAQYFGSRLAARAAISRCRYPREF